MPLEPIEFEGQEALKKQLFKATVVSPKCEYKPSKVMFSLLSKRH